MKKCITKEHFIHILMRVSFPILLLMMAAGISFASHSSAQELLRTKISYEAHNESLKAVLTYLEKSSGVRFTYTTSLVRNKMVSISAVEKPLGQLLHELLNPLRIVYSVSGDFIILQRLPAGKAASGLDLFPGMPQIPENIQPLDRTVTGIVRDEKGEGLPGVNILVKGTQQGMITNSEGRFSLLVPDGEAILVFSFVGYLTEEVVVGSRDHIELTIKVDEKSLEEIVVVGYGTQKKATLTGAIVSASNKELTPAPVIGVSNALAGLLPGVVVSNRSGQPGNTSSILIRGMSTTGNTSPLVVVDGIPGFSGWSYLNPEDIESISVLKDASAAIYGAQAANGVILITTKRGVVGKPTFEYTLNEGLSTVTRLPEMAGAALYAEFANEYRARFNQTPLYTKEQIDKFQAKNDPFYPDINWYDEVLKKFTSQRQHRLSMTGGTESLNYLVAASYSSQDGIFKSGNTNFSTYSVMTRLDGKINDHLKIGVDLNSALDDNYNTGNPFAELGQSLPTTPVFWPNGMPSSGVTAGSNPWVQASEQSGYSSNLTKRYSAKFSYNLQLPWWKSVSSEGYFVYTNNTTFGKNWNKPYLTNSYSYATQEYSVVNGGPQTPTLSESASNSNSRLFHVRLNYTKEIKNHYLSSFVAFEQFTANSNNLSAGRSDFYSDILDQLFAGGLANQTTGGSASNTSRQNVFGRLSYNFSEKYLLDVNLRYDGSSNFPKDKRWGFFPGASVAWRISEENFMRNLPNVDNLKFRLSYGKIGNDAVPAFQWLSTYSLTNRGYTFGGAGETQLGLTQGVNPNNNITWEVANISNVGLDLTMWKNKLDVTVEFFKQRRSNILAKRELAIPGTAGLRLPDENIGIVENKGFEVNIGTHQHTKGGLSYHVSANVAYARNKIVDIDEAANIPEWQKREGRIIGSQLLYKAVKIIRTEEELKSVPIYPGTGVGFLQYEDVNGDGIISEADMVRINESSIPEVTFGINLSAAWKNFDIWANITGQTRAWVQFHKHSKGAGHNSLKELLENRYTPGSMDSKYPIIPDSETRNQDINGFPSTFWQKDASFVRLKTLRISYQLPEQWYQTIGLKGARLFLSGSNLVTLDKLKWYDPEGDRLIGDFYPQSKVYNLGVNVKF